MAAGVAVERVDVSAYTIPAEEPESDGTFEWDSTTVVVVEVAAGGETGLGYTYGPRAVAVLVDELLAPLLTGSDPVIFTGSDPVKAWVEMGRRLRNAGRPGIGAMAMAAVDIALWDLRARLEGLSLVKALEAGMTWCRCTGAEASPRTRTTGLPSSSVAGSTRASRR